MTRLLTLLLCLLAGGASAATLLPNGKQVFVDGNGAPLAGGSVTFYVPSTTTPKQTWQDSGASILNSNPVTLDSNGSAVIYGSGSYREIVQDAAGNVIWDQLTADTAATSQSWAATSGGTSNAQTVTGSSFTSSDGQTIWFRAGYTNTGSLTINPNAVGPLLVYKDTTTGPVQLSGGEVVANNVAGVIYDSVLGGFHLITNIPPSSPNIVSQLTASATTDLGLASTHMIQILGGGTISSFGSSASTSNPLYTLLFNAATTLTSSSSLYVPGSQPAVIAAGGSATVLYTGSGNWSVLSFTLGNGASGLPTGAVVAFALSACPAGWQAADSTNSTPDARGVVIRGLDNGRGLDTTGTTLSGYEADQFQDHTHGNPASGQFMLIGGGAGPLAGGGSFTYSASTVTSTAASGSHGTETRGKSVVLLYCYKY